MFLKWKEPGKQTFFTSPLLFKPCEIKLQRKIENEIHFEVNEDEPWIINPVLKHSLSRFFDLQLPDQTEDPQEIVQSIIKSLNTQTISLVETGSLNEAEKWELISQDAIGNFNYKKSLLAKDFEQIQLAPSNAVLNLIEAVDLEHAEPKDITPILQLDFSQKEVVEKSTVKNLVVQGPPGTGKSHTIVGMIGNFLAEGKKVLFVSQKKAALEVVYQRLCNLGLGEMSAFLNTERNEKKEFYSDLRMAWETFSTPTQWDNNSPTVISTELQDFYLGEYQSFNPTLQGSLHDLILELSNTEFEKKDLEYVGTTPLLKDWKNQLNFLLELEKKARSKFNVQFLSESAFSLLNKSVFAERDPISILDKRTNEMHATLEQIEKTQHSWDIQGSIKELTQICIAASILQMVNRTQLDLLNQDSKSFKSFSNWAKKYELLQAKVARAELGNKSWVNKPTKSEITELIDLLKHRHAPRGILGILQRKNEKLEKAFEGFDKNLTTNGKLQLLEELRSEWNLKAELNEVEIKLKHNFNIHDPKNEVNYILQLRNKLNDISATAYQILLDRDDSLALIEALSKLHPEIQQLNSQSRFLFHSGSITNTTEGKKLIQKIQEQLHGMKQLKSDLQMYFTLPMDVRDFISNNPFTIEKLNAIINYHNLIQQSRFIPAFNKLSAKQLQNELEKTHQNEATYFKENIDRIKRVIHSSVLAVEQLLSTPASKLKNPEKERKKRLKNIKRTLIHEVAKKQRHLALKDFTSQSWELLKEIYPVWIMNPLAVSERFHCEKELFDVVIFDEASQIPLEDSIPAIQRSKQLIVVGDEKQMPPSAFFSVSSDSPTLLDQASIAFEKSMLKWHYRSEHPALIEFSNRYFYNNELLTVPPTQMTNPIELIQVNGIFHEGKNIEEAHSIAKHLEKLKDSDFKDIGIVAFSKEQENTIRKVLSKAKIKQDNLFISNLENVQGIEKKTILISIGYAANKEGIFRLNFGPVNQQNGANRLNVLFSRAKQNIVLFTSISAEDFTLSDNQGVNCLKDYLHYVSHLGGKEDSQNELVSYSKQNGSSIICQINHAKQLVILKDPSTSASDSKDLKTVYTVLNQRFKSVEIKLTKDE